MIGFCRDAIIDRQQEFVTMLVKHQVQIEAQFRNIGFHAIELIDRETANELVEIAKDRLQKQNISSIVTNVNLFLIS